MSTETLTMAICCSGPVVAPLERSEAEWIATRFKALADPTRVQLLNLVARSDAGEACVCDLTEAIGLTQGTISHHLKILVDAGLLERERRGTWAWYRVVPERLGQLAAHLA